jgi:hypothetical protein
MVRGRVPIRGAVAAADVAARQADAQMHPPAAEAEAVLAAVNLGRELADGDVVEVSTGRRSHGASVTALPEPASAALTRVSATCQCQGR